VREIAGQGTMLLLPSPQVMEMGAGMLWRGLITSSMAAEPIGSFQRLSAGSQNSSSSSAGMGPLR
jgi:hypothetical protein